MDLGAGAGPESPQLRGRGADPAGPQARHPHPEQGHQELPGGRLLHAAGRAPGMAQEATFYCFKRTFYFHNHRRPLLAPTKISFKTLLRHHAC